ncbi:MAG: ATP-binding cassette domain-containing protein [Lachnospiraceae bacterium]
MLLNIEAVWREVLVRVGLDASYADRYSTNLSGGECQRANIARALVLRPEFVICDEPVSNLDYSIRKNILNLLKKMQEEYGLTYLLITHDLSNVPYVCQQVAIMYQGKIVEFIDSTDHLEEKVMHPYTQLLFQSIPVKHPKERKTEEKITKKPFRQNHLIRDVISKIVVPTVRNAAEQKHHNSET